MNRIILIGRTTKETELKQTTNGKSVVSFTLAVNRRFAKDKADFIPCVAWDKTAEFIGKYVGKGQMIAVAGELQLRDYTDKNDQKRTVAEVIVDEVQFAGDKPKTSENGNIIASAHDFEEVSAEDDTLPF